MAFQFFVISTRPSGSEAEELNQFLRGHRVLTIDRRWVEQGWESFWNICVEYLEVSAGSPLGSRDRGPGAKPQIDYREVLSLEDFAVFARVRSVRGELAKLEAVPAYTIFTNAQLAEMATSRPATKAELGKIAGVGESRVAKYGERFLAIVAESRGKADEASGRVDGSDPGPR